MTDQITPDWFFDLRRGSTMFPPDVSLAVKEPVSPGWDDDYLDDFYDSYYDEYVDEDEEELLEWEEELLGADTELEALQATELRSDPYDTVPVMSRPTVLRRSRGTCYCCDGKASRRHCDRQALTEAIDAWQ